MTNVQAFFEASTSDEDKKVLKHLNQKDRQGTHHERSLGGKNTFLKRLKF
jgi:hypothetical protein